MSDPTPKEYGRPDPMIWVVVLLIAFGGSMRLGAPEARLRTPDEFTYAEYARTLRASGWVAGTRQLTVEYAADSAAWTTPPPTRIGYVGLLASFMGLVGDSGLDAGTALSRLASVLGLAVAAAIAWMWGGPWSSVFTVILLSGAPLDLAISRRAWQDGVVGFASALLVLLALLAVQPGSRRRTRFLVAFGLTGVWVASMKLTGGMILSVVTLGASLALWAQTRRTEAKSFLATGLAALVVAVLLSATAAGGPDPLYRVFRSVAENLAKVPYNQRQQNGPASYGLEALWLLSPFTLVCFGLGLVRSVATVGRRRADPTAGPRSLDVLPTAWVMGALSCFALLLLALTSLAPYLKNLRFFSAGLVPMAIVAGWGLGVIVEQAGGTSHLGGASRRWVVATLLAVCAAGAHMEHDNFRRIVTVNDFPDATLPFIREGLGRATTFRD